MGVMISQLPGLESISPEDMLELEKKNDNESYSLTMKQLSDYVKSLSNGGFKGATNKNLDEFDVADAGVYFWSGNGGPDGMPMGFLEVMAVYSYDDYAGSAFSTDMNILIQRITYGKYVYQRMRGIGATNWSEWGGLTNENGCKILYGQSNETKVWFSDDHRDVFAEVPVVTVTPINSGVTELYFVNVESVTNSYFTVKRYVAPLVERKVVTSSSSTESSSGGTTTKTETEEVTRTDGAITLIEDNASSSFTFNWQAMSDVPATKFKAT